MIKHILFATFSLVILAELSFVIHREMNPEWKPIQAEYYNLLSEKMGDENLKSAPLKLQQTWNSELNRADRCTTCHMGIDKPNFKDAPQPYTTHPDLDSYIGKHPFSKFGCTVCHEGEGRALAYASTHGEVEHLDKQPLNGIFLQSACSKCHFDVYAPDTNIPEMPALMKAKRLVFNAGCRACHTIKQFGFTGAMGPDLSTFGSGSELSFFLLHDSSYYRLKGEHTMVNWLIEHFEDPKRMMPGSPAQNLGPTIMPKFGFTKKEAEELTTLVLSFKDNKVEAIPRSFFPQMKENHKGYQQYQ